MVGEILPDSDHVSILSNFRNYLSEFEELMDYIGENLSTEGKSLMINTHRSRKKQKKVEIENNKQSRKQKKGSMRPTSKSFSEKTHCDSAGFRHNTAIDNPYCKSCSLCYPATAGYIPCEGNNYFMYPSLWCKNPHHRKAKGVFKANECYEIENDQGSKKSSQTSAMRVIQDDMKDLKEKLSTVVETLTNVVDALVKSTKKQDEGDEKFDQSPSKGDSPDFEITKKTVQQFGNEEAVQFSSNNVKSRGRGRSGICCLGSRSVKSTESDSDYYRPEQSHNSKSKSQKKGHQKCPESSVFEYEETSSSENRKSQTCHNVTVCYLLQQLFYRVKLLFS